MAGQTMIRDDERREVAMTQPERIEYMLEALGITAYRFAKECHLTEATVSRWRSDACKISQSCARQIEDRFPQFSTPWIMGETLSIGSSTTGVSDYERREVARAQWIHIVTANHLRKARKTIRELRGSVERLQRLCDEKDMLLDGYRGQIGRDNPFWHVPEHYLGDVKYFEGIPMPRLMTQPERIEYMLEALGMSAAKFAKECGFTEASVSYWRTGSRVIGQTSAHRIEDRFPQFSTPWIMGETSFMNEDQKNASKAFGHVPEHYLGDGFVTCDRAIESASSQDCIAERSKLQFWYWATAMKYVWRMWSKEDPEKDALKAIDCLEKAAGLGRLVREER